MTHRLAPLVAAFAAAFCLCGCITLFPKTQPEPLYRFGNAPAATQGPANARFSVLDDTLAFDVEAAGDRILTVNGDEVAYVKGGRWAAAATTLFREAVQRAFDAAGGPARLVEHGEAVKVDKVLRLDVSRFEARYENGAGAAPTVLVRVHASLSGYSDHNLVGEQTFEAQVAAADNRLGPITQAFDRATSQVVGGIVSWVEQSGS